MYHDDVLSVHFRCEDFPQIDRIQLSIFLSIEISILVIDGGDKKVQHSADETKCWKFAEKRTNSSDDFSNVELELARFQMIRKEKLKYCIFARFFILFSIEFE